MHLCIYCSSSDAIAAQYQTVAEHVGQAMAEQGWTLVYGGGSIGLMGIVARTVHRHGGRVIGIIPQALLDREVGYHDADELIVTPTMRERKRMMDERADAFLTLPGGFGTLEELVEIITLKQLGYHQKPIVILNQDGFYDPLLLQFERYFTSGFTHERYRRLYTVTDDIHEALALCGRDAGQ